MTGVPSSYHDWTHGKVLPGLLVTTKGQSLHAQIGWWFGKLFCFLRLLLFTASTIWTLTHWTHPRSQHSNIYFRSTFIIYILDFGCLVSANFWLPSGCWEKQVRPAEPGVSTRVAGDHEPCLRESVNFNLLYIMQRWSDRFEINCSGCLHHYPSIIKYICVPSTVCMWTI